MLHFFHVRGVTAPRVVSWSVLGFVRKRRPRQGPGDMQALPVVDLSWAVLPGAAQGYTPVQTPRAAPYPEQRLASQPSTRGDLDFSALPGWARPQAHSQPPAPGRLGPEEWAGGGGWAPDSFPTHTDSGWSDGHLTWAFRYITADEKLIVAPTDWGRQDYGSISDILNL